MSPHRVVVDGSNIATEGRSLPSLVQLDEAVRAYRDEHPDAEIIVVVDATFAHRIDDSERAMFEEAAAHNELVYPPAGAIGRGDAFLLRIADKTDSVVLSNDSFQEFHGEFEWLFTKGRLIGGTPVPGVGWIFVPRTPVRGPKSREAVKEAKRTKPRIGSKDASQPMPVPKAPPPRAPKNKNAKGGDNARPSKGSQAKPPRLEDVIEEATEEAVAGELPRAAEGGGGGKGRKRRRRKAKSAVLSLPTVNEPLTFIEFIADHQPGATVEGEIESFASHGAFVVVGDARCYIPLSAMGDPPPRSAREILNRGEIRTFVVQALDAPRRGIELALPGFEHIAGRPTDETVEAEIDEAPPPIHAQQLARQRGDRRGAVAARTAAPDGPVVDEPEKAARRNTAKKAAADVIVAGVPAKRAAEKAPEGEAAPAKAAPAKAATKAATKKAAPVKKAAATKAPATKAPAKKAPAKKASTTKAPAKKASTTKASTTKASTTKAPATKALAKKASTTKAPAKRASTTNAATQKTSAPAGGSTKAASSNSMATKAPAGRAPARKAAKKPAS